MLTSPAIALATVESAAELLQAIGAQVQKQIPYVEADDAAYFARSYIQDVDLDVAVKIMIERAIIRRAVTDILAAHQTETVDRIGGPAYSISVYDGEELTVRESRDLGQIMGALMSTDDDQLIVRWLAPASADGRTSKVGFISLVYGNDGYDVIADNSTSIEHLLEGATALANAIEENEIA